MPGAANPEGRILNVPNFLTVARLAAVPVVVGLLLGERYVAAALIFAAAAVTDFFDGVIARRSARITRFGRILDPAADRLMVSSSAVVLAYRDLLPAWAVVVLVGRDVLALAGGLIFGSRVRVNRVGKAATAVLMPAVFLIMFGLEEFGEIMFYVGFGLSLISGLLYAGKISGLGKEGGR